MKLANAQEIIQIFEQWAPKSLAEDWDPVGLQVGTLSKKVSKVMITLDVLESVVDEAINENVDLIIAHHPLLFNPLKKLDTARPQGKLIERLIKHDITVYAAHTNLDAARGGVSDLLAEKLGIPDTKVMVPTTEIKLKKLVVFVPADYAEKVRVAITNAGAGYIGNYSDCTFNIEGTGTFLPREGTDPFIGDQGKLEMVEEIRIETIYPENIEKSIIAAMTKAHPYEEIAYDLYPLTNKGESFGYGRVGKIAKSMKLGEFAQFVKEALDLESVRLVGELDADIQKVAVLGGSGNDFIYDARFSGADVLVTGDIKYHTAHEAMQEGLNIIDAGHYIESVMKEGVAAYLKNWFESKKYQTEIITSKVNTDPFKFM